MYICIHIYIYSERRGVVSAGEADQDALIILYYIISYDINFPILEIQHRLGKPCSHLGNPTSIWKIMILRFINIIS